MKSKYKVVADYRNDNKVINLETGKEYLITRDELIEFNNYCKDQLVNNISYTNALKHMDDYIDNLIA